MTFDPFAGQIFADNAWRVASSPGRQERLDPATLAPVGRIALVERAEVEAVVDRANAAQRDWAKVDAKTRAALLHRVAQPIQDDGHHDVAELMSREMGKPWGEALGEIANVAPVFRYMAELARDEAGKVAGTTQAGSFQFARYEPYGVSVHIMPFNFPILLMCWTVAASLACGNAVVIKPAEPTTLSTLAFMKHFSCLPPGLVSCLPGGGATGRRSPPPAWGGPPMPRTPPASSKLKKEPVRPTPTWMSSTINIISKSRQSCANSRSQRVLAILMPPSACTVSKMTAAVRSNPQLSSCRNLRR